MNLLSLLAMSPLTHLVSLHCQFAYHPCRMHCPAVRFKISISFMVQLVCNNIIIKVYRFGFFRFIVRIGFFLKTNLSSRSSLRCILPMVLVYYGLYLYYWNIKVIIIRKKLYEIRLKTRKNTFYGLQPYNIHIFTKKKMIKSKKKNMYGNNNNKH